MKNMMARLRMAMPAIAPILIFAVLSSSCTSSKPMLQSKNASPERVKEAVSKLYVGSTYEFLLTNKKRIRLELQGVENEIVRGKSAGGQHMTVPIAEISQIYALKFDTAPTVLLVLAGAIVFFYVIMTIEVDRAVNRL